eukprot:scaffold203746_cov30-Tisochrysis_lutea.AAC.2
MVAGGVEDSLSCLHIGQQSIEHGAAGRKIEEVHRSFHQGVEHSGVQRSGRPQGTESQQYCLHSSKHLRGEADRDVDKQRNSLRRCRSRGRREARRRRASTDIRTISARPLGEIDAIADRKDRRENRGDNEQS